jgi:hypothetical protein
MHFLISDVLAEFLLPQHDCAALIEANDVEFLPISMPTTATAVLSIRDMA